MKVLLNGAAVRAGHLILVNPSHPIAGDAAEDRLVTLPGSSILLERQAARLLREALAAVGGGEAIVPVSGYRSLREQQTIFSDSLREHGEEFTRKYVALPGCSEHQTGLAIDLALKADSIDFIRPHFPRAGVCGRFRELAPRYGFIERYPAGKEALTRISHEPWHFRYVGVPHAEIMEGRGLTLEEYTELLRAHPWGGEPLRYSREGCGFEVFYAAVEENGRTELDLPCGLPYQLSGNNAGGVVVTLWRERS